MHAMTSPSMAPEPRLLFLTSLSLTVLAAPLAGLKARFAAYMDTAAEQGMTPEMFAQACAKGMAEQERRAMQEQAARDADPKQPQEDSPVSTPTP